MLHISQMIDNANKAVSDIQVAHGKVIMELMKRSDLTHEKKLSIIELLEPITTSVKVAQSKFAYNVVL